MIGLLLVLPLVVGPVAADGSEVAFRLPDARITESSGLVDTGEVMFTVNDSGNEPRLFELDADTGRTTRTIRFADTATDVEALAPDGPGVVWVGDIGDNTRVRDHVVVYRVDVRTGAVESRELRYPDGSRDAEAMLVGRDGRVTVVTKGLAGEVYVAAPGENNLTQVARVGMAVTDGALMPDETHVLLRDYANLHLYSFPDFDHLASMRLPRQPQGEGLSVSPDGRVRVSSEGVRQPVYDVRLSAEMKEALSPRATSDPTPTPTVAPSVTDAPSPPPVERPRPPHDEWPAWAWASLLLVPLSLGIAVAFAKRPR